MCLVAWEDNRDAGANDRNIYASRVSAAGTVLDPVGFAISRTSDLEEKPAVASDGTNFLVVWADWSEQNGRHIRAARVTAAGVVLDPSGLLIAAGSFVVYPNVTWDGTNYLVAWLQNNSIAAAFVSRAGAVLSPGVFIVSTAAGVHEPRPAVASGNANSVVVWSAAGVGVPGAPLYAARISDAGVVLDPSGITISTAPAYTRFASVAWDGTNYFIVWEHYGGVSPPYGSVYGARVSGTGAVLDPGGLPLMTPPGQASYEFPSVAWCGTHHLVTWTHRFQQVESIVEAGAARVTAAGTMLDPAGLAVSTPPTTPWDLYGVRTHATWDGTNCFVTWNELRYAADAGRIEESDIRRVRVTAAGAVVNSGGQVIVPP